MSFNTDDVELKGREESGDILKEYKDVLTPKDVQNILQTGRNTVYKYLSEGTIRSIRVGGKYRIPKIYLISFIYQDAV